MKNLVLGGYGLYRNGASHLQPFSCSLFIDMLVAYIVGDRGALLSFFSNLGKFYAAAPYTFLFASLMVLIFGPGLFSVDTLIVR